jgi:PAS domain S-box-containing protein
MKDSLRSWGNRLLSVSKEDAENSLLLNLIRRTDQLAYLFLFALIPLIIFTKAALIGVLAIVVVIILFGGVLTLNRRRKYNLSRAILILAIHGYLTFDYWHDDNPNHVLIRIIVPVWVALLVYESRELLKVLGHFAAGTIMLTYSAIQLQPDFQISVSNHESYNIFLLLSFTGLMFLFSKELENNYYRKIRLKQVQVESEALYHQTYLQLQAIFSASSDALFIFNPDQLTIKDANQKAIELFHADQKEAFIGMTIQNLFKEHFALLSDVNNQPQQDTLQCQTLDGQFTFWCEIHVQIIDTETSRIGFLQIHDIDEQQQNYEKLKTTLQQLRETQQFGQIGTWRIKLTTGEAFISEQYRELLDYPVDIPPTFDMLQDRMNADEFILLRHEIQKGIASKTDFHFAFTIHLEGGIQRTLLARCHPVINDEGVVTELYGATMNISGLKRMQTIAEANEKRFRTLFENAPLAIWTTTPTGQVRIFNPATAILLGLDEQKTVKLRIGHIIHPDDQRLYHMNRDLLLQMSDAKSLQFEVRLLHQKGKIIWGKMSLTIMQDADSDTCYYLHMVTDISTEKHKEAELQKAKRSAEEANRAKTDFLAHLSHDLRNPLNGIMGATELLDEKLTEDKLKHFTQMIRLSGKKLTQNISNILDFSRLEAGKTIIVEEVFSLKQLCYETSVLYTEIAQEKGLNFTAHCENMIYEWVIGDQYLVSRILDNLLGNALKFTESGGITCRIDQQNGITDNIIQTTFIIQDTGIGIKPEDLEKLFVPFSQLDRSSTKLYQGTGLGLAISKELANKMGGDITVHSEYGIGTTFRVSVPFVKGALPDTLNEDTVFLKETPFDPSQYRILIAEDDEVNAEYLLTLLREKGYQTDVVYNGKQLLKKLQQKTYDILLLDGAMPYVDGYQAAAQIRQDENNSSDHRLTIIGVTGYALSHDRDKFLQAGADDYLTKPIDQNALLQMIQEYLRAKS